MTRRDITSTLHWLVLLLLVLMVARRGESEVLAWAFGLAGLLQLAIALVMGRMNSPGPALTGQLRAAYPILQWAMYALLGWTALAALSSALHFPLPGPDSVTLGFWLFGAACLHGIFHFWRHSVLGDGAVRRILPSFVAGGS